MSNDIKTRNFKVSSGGGGGMQRVSQMPSNSKSSSSSSSSSSFGEYLKSLDYFSVTFNFRVDKKPKYGSVQGGLTFIIFLLVAIGYTLKRVFDYISWTDSKIQFIEKSINPAPVLNFKNLSFSYAVKITFENDTNIKDTYLSDLFIVEQNYVYKNTTNSNKIHSFPHNCTDDDFYNQTANFSIFQKDSIQSFSCFPIDANYTLQGSYTDSFMTYIEILAKINETYFAKYEDLIKIFEKESFKFTLYYIDSFNDVSNYDNPVFYKVDAIYTYLDLNYFKRNNVNFQQFRYSSDRNLFYNNYIENIFMKLYSNQEILSPLINRGNSQKEEKNYLNKFFLRAVNNEKIVKLSFVKIPELLASLTGLLVNILVVLSIILTALNYFEAKQNIISKIMKYKDVIYKNDKNSLTYLHKRFKKNDFVSLQKPDETRPENPNNIYPNMDAGETKYNNNNYIINNKVSQDIILTESLLQEEQNQNQNQLARQRDISSVSNRTESDIKDKLNDTFDSEKSSLEKLGKNKNPYLIRVSDLFKVIFCCRCRSKSYNKKIHIFHNAETKFNHNLDLVTFMKKMQEIEILKYLILNKDTIHLMNFISKPSVCMSNTNIGNDEEYQLFFENMKNTNTLNNQSIDNARAAFDNLMKKENLSDVEKRVLKLFKLQINEILC